MSRAEISGFTLIELSIVLVIIGLITGGILVGRDLIAAAAVRAQVSQIEKYNSAVNTFRGKYGYLPGDIPSPYATQFGFVARGSGSGQGNGDGVLKGVNSDGVTPCGFCQDGGEVLVFWMDLSAAHLIDGNFNSASETSTIGSIISGTNLDLYLPQAKIGNGNYVNVWSGGTGLNWSAPSETGNNGLNYYSVSAVSQLNGFAIISNPGLTVAQAYSIDKKMDDGLPQLGNVTANFLGFMGGAPYSPRWAGTFPAVIGGPYTSAKSGGATTCFDNGGTTGTQQYSMLQSNGNGVNCALSFAFQ